MLGVEGVLAEVEGLELVVRLQVRPPPHPAVDHVREPLPVRNLMRVGKVRTRYPKIICAYRLALFYDKHNYRVTHQVDY